MAEQPKNQGQRLRTLRRTTTTGAIIVAAYMMFLMAPGGGGKDDGGSESPTTATVTEVASQAASSLDSPTVNPLAAPNMVLSAQVGATQPAVQPDVIDGGVLTVVIDEHDYYVQVLASAEYSKEATLRRVTLEEIAGHMADATGDSNGIRVRVLRRNSARASAEAKLQAALRQSAVEPDAIYVAEELLP